jgi:hypothetical protein
MAGGIELRTADIRCVFHLETGALGGDIASVRYKIIYKQAGKTARDFLVRQMPPAYMGSLIVLPTNGELIYQHVCKLRDQLTDACDFRHS